MKSIQRTSSTSRRKYDATRRQADASERRRRVVEAATRLFLDQGYGQTSIDQIAKAADVSPQMVYAAFESKAGVLAAAETLARTGGEVGGVHETEAAARIMAETDLAKRSQMTARLLRETYGRSARLARMVERAAATDPAIAEVLDHNNGLIRSAVVIMTASIPTSAFRKGVSREQAVDVMTLLSHPHAYADLVFDRGWTPARYERWLADALQRMVLEPADGT